MADLDTSELSLMAKLLTKLHLIMGQVEKLQKKGYNEQFDFYYIRHADALEAIRYACVLNKLALLITTLSVTQTPTGAENRSGKPFVRTVVTKQYTLADVETGYCHSLIHQGECIEAEDKGLSKASVSCDKYFLLSAFMIPGELEPDAARAEAERRAASPRQAGGARAHGEGSQRTNPVPEGKNAFGFVPRSWPHPKAFEEAATDPQKNAIKKIAEEEGCDGDCLKLLEGVILRAFGIDKWSKGAASLVLDFMKGATEEQKDAAAEAMTAPA